MGASPFRRHCERSEAIQTAALTRELVGVTLRMFLSEIIPMVSHSIEIKAELADRLDALASRFDLSSNVLASVAIEAMLDLGQWQIAEIEAGLAEAERGDFASDGDLKAVFYKFKLRA